MSLLNILILGLYILKASGISQISTTQYPPSVQNSIQQFQRPNDISTLVVSAPKIKIKTTSQNKPLDKAKKLVKNAQIIKPKKVKSRFNKNSNDTEDRQNFSTYNFTNYYYKSYYPYRGKRSINILTQGKNSTTITNNKDYVQSPILLSAITPIIVDYLPNNQTEPPLPKSQTNDIITSHINPIEELIEIEGVIRLNPITPIIMTGEQMVNTKSFDKLNQTAGGAAKIVKDDYLDDNDELDKYTEPSYELSTPNIYQQKNVNDDADQVMSQMSQRKSRIFFNDGVIPPPKNDKIKIDIQGYDKSTIESVEKESYQIFEDVSKHKSLESLSSESWTNESLINETLLPHDNIDTQEKILKPFQHTLNSDYLGNDQSINKGIKSKKVNVIENFYNETIEEISHISSNYTIDMPISFDENSFSSEHQKNKIIGMKSQNIMVKATYEQENDNKTEITEFNEKLKLHLDTTSAASQLFITVNPRIKTEYDNISIAQTHVGQFVDDNKTYDKNRSIIYDNYMLSLKQLSERIDETQESEEVIKTMINLEDETNVENDNALKDISKTTAFYQTFRPTTTSYSFDTPKEIWVTWSQGSVRLEEYLLNETESNQTNSPKSVVDVKGKKSYNVDSSSIIKQIETDETEQTTEEEFLHVKKHHNDVKDVSETKTFLYHNKSSVIIESDNENDYNIKTIRHKSNDTHDKFKSQQTMRIPEFKPTINPIFNLIIKDDNSKNIGETSKGINNQKISGVKDTVQHNEQLTEKTIEQISYVEANEKNENYFINSRNKTTFFVENNNISVNDRIQQLNNATTRHSLKNLTIPDVSSNVTMSIENGYYNMEQQDVKSIKTDLGIVNKTHSWMDVKFNNENVNDYANKQQNYYGTNSSFVHTKNTTSNNYTFETKNEVNDDTINKNIVYFKTQYDNTKHDVVQLKNKTLATTDVTENQKMVAVDNVLHQDLANRQKSSEKKKDKKIKDKIPKQKTTEKPIKVHFGKTHVSNKQVVDVDEVKTDINVLKSISSSDMEASIKQPPNSEPIDIIQKTFDNPKYKGKEWHYVGKDLDLKISQTEYVDDKTYNLPTNVETNTVRIVQNNKLGIEFDNIRESDITTIHDTQIVAPTIDDDAAIIKTVFTGIDDEEEETKFQNIKETSFNVESTNKPTIPDYKDYNPILSHSIHTPLANKQFSPINKPEKQSESDFGNHHEMPRGDIMDAVEVDENIKLLSIDQTPDDYHNKFKQNKNLKESSTQQTKINQHSILKYEMIDDQKTYLPQRGDTDQHSNSDKTILFSQSNTRNVMDRGPSSLHAIKLIKVDRFTQSDGTEVEVKTYSGIGENGERITYTQTSKRKTVIQQMPTVITYDLDRKVLSGVGQTFNEKIGKMSQSINSKSAQSNYDTANYYETKHDKQHDKIKKLHDQKIKKVQGDVILLQTPRDESLVLREKSYKLQNILNTPKTGVHNHYRYYKEDDNTYHNTRQQLNNYPPSRINSNIQNHYAIENTGDNVRTYIVQSARPHHQRISNTNTKDYNYRALSHSPPHKKLKNQSPSSSRSQNLRYESDQYNRGTYYNDNHQNYKFNPVLNHHGQTENQRINKYNFEIDEFNPYGPQSRPQPHLFAVPENFDPIIMHESSAHEPSTHNYPSSFVNNAHTYKNLRQPTSESKQPQMVGQQASRKRNKRYLNSEEHEDTHHYENRHMPDYPVHTFGVGERVEYEEEGRRYFHRPTRAPYKTMSPVKRTTLKVTTSSQPKYETKKARYYKTTPYHKIPKAKVTHSPQIGTTGSAFTTQNVSFKQKGLKGFSCGKTKLKIDFSSSEENSSNEERILPKVVGGEEAVAGSWPWIVLLKYLGEPACGGTIIGPNHVLTATHCFPNYIEAWNFTITAGIHIKESVGLPLEQIRRIKKLTKHIHFDRDNKYDNDIALIEVDKPFIFGDYVQPICIPEQNETVPVGTICCIAGFGETRGSSQDTALNELCLPMMSTKTCNSTEYYNGRLTSTMICAGFEEGQKDACKGDSGGPLTCEIEGIHKLIGVVSWGQGCAREKKPGIYTNVALFNKWINENL